MSFFALFGCVFLITQYFQLVRGYDTLSAGVHTLPFAIATGTVAPLAPALAHRLGTKIVVPLGLVMMGGGFVVAATLSPTTPFFGPVLISMVLIAAGLGLVAVPSTEAILAVLPPAKAGVGSAVNEVTRELGGAFGVAVVGAVFSSVTVLTWSIASDVSEASIFPLPPWPQPGVGGGRAARRGHGSGSSPRADHPRGRQSFVDGMARGSLLCAGVVIAGGIADQHTNDIVSDNTISGSGFDGIEIVGTMGNTITNNASTGSNVLNFGGNDLVDDLGNCRFNTWSGNDWSKAGGFYPRCTTNGGHVIPATSAISNSAATSTAATPGAAATRPQRPGRQLPAADAALSPSS